MTFEKKLLQTSKKNFMYSNSLARHFYPMFHTKCLLPRLDRLLPVRSCLKYFYQWGCSPVCLHYFVHLIYFLTFLRHCTQSRIHQTSHCFFEEVIRKTQTIKWSSWPWKLREIQRIFWWKNHSCAVKMQKINVRITKIVKFIWKTAEKTKEYLWVDEIFLMQFTRLPRSSHSV